MNGASRGTDREDSPGAPLAVAPRILLVDDDPSVCALLQAQLTRRGFEVQPALSVSEALRLLEDTEIEVVLTDIVMEGMDGLQLCAQVVADRPELPVVILTASERLETAIGAMRAGAYDFVTKPIDLEVLTLALERAVKKRRLVATVERLSRALEEATGFDELVVESPVMRKVYGLLGRVAQSEASVLITGESGTGKERVVRAVGGKDEVPFDVHLITATNQDLRAAVAEHRFREDLFFRVAVIQIELPPLRARGTDVLLLAQHFVERYGERTGKRVRGLSRVAAECLLGYPWPGNVRELQNCIERAVALTMS